jgi:pilus assembly protein Flp/PilA
VKSTFYRLSTMIQSFVTRVGLDRGQTMAEYGILIAVIAIIVVVAAVVLGTNLSNLFHDTATKV